MEKITITLIAILSSIVLIVSCGCNSNDKEQLAALVDGRDNVPLRLEVKLPREVSLAHIQSNAINLSRDPTTKTNKYKQYLSEELYDKSNAKHYLSIRRSIPYIITNVSRTPVYFLWRRVRITAIRLRNEKSGENIECRYIEKHKEVLFGSMRRFDPICVLTLLEPGENIIGYTNPIDYSNFPNPKSYSDMRETPWDLTIEMEFYGYPYHNVNMFSGNLISDPIKVIIYPYADEGMP